MATTDSTMAALRAANPAPIELADELAATIDLSRHVLTVVDTHEDASEATAIDRRRKRRWLTIAAVVAALMAVTVPALATQTGWLDSLLPGTPVPTNALVAALGKRGALVPLSEIPGPLAHRITDLRKLGTRQGNIFYSYEFQGHFGPRRCYEVVPESLGGVIGDSKCPPPGTFPSPQEPIFDLSNAGADRGQPMQTVDLEGVAADGVAAVGVLGSDGNVYGKTTVVGNLFVSKDLPVQANGPIVAYDSNGRTVWCDQSPTPIAANVLEAAGCANPSTPQSTTG